MELFQIVTSEQRGIFPLLQENLRAGFKIVQKYLSELALLTQVSKVFNVKLIFHIMYLFQTLNQFS